MLSGTALADPIQAFGGNDVVLGRGGNDSIDLGAGDDFADGGEGNDTILGGDGSDLLSGGAGNDLPLDGGANNDTYLFGAGDGQDVAIDTQALQPFWASAKTFIEDGDPGRWRRADESDRRLGRPPVFGDRDNQLRVLRGKMSNLSVFRYAKPIDIDNDGVADPVVIWRSGNCKRFGPVDKMFYWDSIPIVLNAVGEGPDVERTRQLFGHPSGGYRLSSGKMASEFRPIGRSIAIFQFEGTYYMDTFFDAWGDFNGNLRDAPASGQPLPSREPEVTNSLAVFLRRGSETRQVCEYWFEDFSEARHRATRRIPPP